MSGHSKWHNIRLRKGKQDSERGKLFTRLAREVIVAAKDGGGSPETNARLRLAIEKAREASMPMDNIKRAIDRGTGAVQGISYEEVTYEGYAPGGVAVMVSAMTDNKNRTVAEIRNAFNRGGGALGEAGCVGWMFEQRGVIFAPRDGVEEEALMMTALDAGAEDVVTDDESFEVLTDPSDLHTVADALKAAGFNLSSTEVTMAPKNTVQIEGKQADQVLRLMDALEELDDVQQVYANFEMPEGAFEAVGAE
ncbi:MAG TPA: YebC/PmpR family DNA-binding transcriptional regulator [Armatimonadota bacterium]|nr:YebC/PmpR family DNA-binding transcriptional regulator [Armatimonadota bacterium]